MGNRIKISKKKNQKTSKDLEIDWKVQKLKIKIKYLKQMKVLSIKRMLLI